MPIEELDDAGLIMPNGFEPFKYLASLEAVSFVVDNNVCCCVVVVVREGWFRG